MGECNRSYVAPQLGALLGNKKLLPRFRLNQLSITTSPRIIRKIGHNASAVYKTTWKPRFTSQFAIRMSYSEVESIRWNALRKSRFYCLFVRTLRKRMSQRSL